MLMAVMSGWFKAKIGRMRLAMVSLGNKTETHNIVRGLDWVHLERKLPLWGKKPLLAPGGRRPRMGARGRMMDQVSAGGQRDHASVKVDRRSAVENTEGPLELHGTLCDFVNAL